jgi:4-hydroxybenzoate polyprenyltransferase
MTDPPLCRNDNETAFHPRTADAFIERQRRRCGTVVENDRHIRWYEIIEGGSIRCRLDFGSLFDQIEQSHPATALHCHITLHTMVPAAVALLRPKHWIKNVIVFAPLIFAKGLFNPPQVLTSVRAFVAFCLTASAVYILNDIADAESDRAHPEKKNRPLASGAITRRSALTILVLLLCVDGFLCAGMEVKFILVIVAYFLLNLAYSFRLKEVILLDVFLIAAGFMLRVLGGACAISVQVSSWIVLCSMFISLFLGFAKRRGELVNVQGAESGAPRHVLRLYRVEFLDQMLTISAAGAVIAYALYTVAPRTLAMFGTENLIYTTIFVIYGVFRYLYLIHSGKHGENPTNALTSDIPIIVNGVLWVLTCVYLIYLGG